MLMTRHDSMGGDILLAPTAEGLDNRGRTAEDVFRVLDWLVPLSPQLEQGFADEVDRQGKERLSRSGEVGGSRTAAVTD